MELDHNSICSFLSSTHAAFQRSGLDINARIAQNKTFGNPSIYEQLVNHTGITETGLLTRNPLRCLNMLYRKQLSEGGV